MSEYLDVRDIDGNKTGEVVERGKHRKNECYYLTVHAYILTKNNKFIIQRRSMNKEYFPGLWDITCGAVLSGEGSYDAVIREVYEELGLDVSNCKYELLGRSIYADCLNDIYLFHTSYSINDCNIDLNEVMDVKEINKSELLDFILKSDFKNEDYYFTILKGLPF